MANKVVFTIRDALIAYLYVANGSLVVTGKRDRVKGSIGKFPMQFSRIVWYESNNPYTPIVVPTWLMQKECA